MTTLAQATVGDLLRGWRQRRRLSQLALAVTANISQRHVSFLESGRSLPSREMVLQLSRVLEIPPRERNSLLVAAGLAPIYRERALSDPELAEARRAVELVLAAYEPFPALAVDRHWTLVLANAALAPLLASVHPSLLRAPVNVLRVSLHPDWVDPTGGCSVGRPNRGLFVGGNLWTHYPRSRVRRVRRSGVRRNAHYPRSRSGNREAGVGHAFPVR